MEIRPEFKEIKTFDEFIKYYWYKEELQKICKDLGIDHSGSKGDLNHNIEAYFNGQLIKKVKRVSVKKKDIELTLDTKLLESGFAMRNEYREFFGKQVGVKNFKFTADMAAAIKKVRQEKNKDFTVRDLIDVYYGKSDYAEYDSSACQWNKFLKGFCQDERNNIYKDKLKAAAALWKQVRLSTLDKVYDYSMVDIYRDVLEEFRTKE